MRQHHTPAPRTPAIVRAAQTLAVLSLFAVIGAMLAA